LRNTAVHGALMMNTAGRGGNDQYSTVVRQNLIALVVRGISHVGSRLLTKRTVDHRSRNEL
jgi:hypothetical protein